MKKKVIQEVNRIKALANINESMSDDEVLNIVDDFLKNATEDEKKDERYEKIKKFFTDIIPGVSREDLKRMNVSASGQELLNDPSFDKKLSDLSSELNVSKTSLINLMNHESRLRPSIKNNIGCVGLIQLCPDEPKGPTKTINGTKYDLGKVQTDLDYQMDAVRQFLLSGKKSGKIKRDVDLFIYTFFPIAAGKDDDFVLKSDTLSAQEVAHDNPVFNTELNRDINTPLTVGDLKTYYRKKGLI